MASAASVNEDFRAFVRKAQEDLAFHFTAMAREAGVDEARFQQFASSGRGRILSWEQARVRKVIEKKYAEHAELADLGVPHVRASLDARLEALARQVDENREQVAQNQAQLSKRVGSLSDSLAELARRLDGLEDRRREQK